MTKSKKSDFEKECESNIKDFSSTETERGEGRRIMFGDGRRKSEDCECD